MIVDIHLISFHPFLSHPRYHHRSYFGVLVTIANCYRGVHQFRIGFAFLWQNGIIHIFKYILMAFLNRRGGFIALRRIDHDIETDGLTGPLSRNMPIHIHPYGMIGIIIAFGFKIDDFMPHTTIRKMRRLDNWRNGIEIRTVIFPRSVSTYANTGMQDKIRTSIQYVIITLFGRMSGSV
mgnify:CR=1 FL=1